MPIRDKDRYNEYMRNYMKQRHAQKKSGNDAEVVLPKENKIVHPAPETADFDATQGKPELNLQGDATSELMKLARETFKGEDGKPDKVITYIEQGIKYMPLIMQFVKGFAESAKAFQATQATQLTDQRKVRPPEGWEYMSPMERLKYKYGRPEWYRAGELYEQFNDGGYMNPAVDIHRVDSGYHDPEPRSLKDLSKRYSEPPLVHDQTPIQQSTREEKPMQQPQQNDQLVQALQQDNARYIQLAVQFIGSMKLDDFKQKIENIDTLVEQYKPMLELLPIHLREMLKKTSDDEFMKIFKETCTDKFAWCEMNGKLPKIKELFNQIKSSL